MSEEANREIARRIWEAGSAGNPDPVLAFDPAVVWRTCGRGEHAREHHGIDGILGYFSGLGEGVSDSHSELINILASDDGAIIHYRVHAERGPKSLDGQFFLWLRIEAGAVSQAVVIPWDQAANDAFWRLE